MSVNGRSQPFNLLRWFSALSFITVAAGAVGTAAALSHFVAAEILHWDAVITAEFIASLGHTQSTYRGYLRESGVAELLGGTTTADDLGIGLTLAKRTLERYGGGVRIESRESIGTQVELTFAVAG